MIPLTLRQVRQIVAGKAPVVIPDDAREVSAIGIDSRKIEKGSLFIAIAGETFDGHDFIAEAAARGAIGALVEIPLAQFPPGLALIQVPGTRIALGKLARHVRQQLRAKVIAVAGSNGKTSTKQLIHAALRGRLKGIVSPKSFNNDIGVPLTLLPAESNCDYVVLEMGTNHHGEIKPLSDMAQPDIAVITNCGAEHLEGLTDLAGVRRENAQVTSGLNPKGLLIVNGDDPDLLAAVSDWSGRRLTFGLKPSNDVFATNITCTARGTEFSMNSRSQRVFVPMLGKHSAVNALAAIAVARSMRLAEEQIIESLAHCEPPEMRLQIQQAGSITLLNDSYNANPNSMRAAIETLAALDAGRRVAVLGDMLELGPTSERHHREIGAFLAAAGKVDALICVGPRAKWIAAGALAAGYSADAMHQFDDAAGVMAAIPAFLRERDLVLLKGSRGMRLDKVAAAIIASFPSGAG